MTKIQFGAWRSPVSALDWGSRGRRFNSDRSDTILESYLWSYSIVTPFLLEKPVN